MYIFGLLELSFPFGCLAIVLFAACFTKLRRDRTPLLVVEPEDDVRDNVVFYDEEGAG